MKPPVRVSSQRRTRAAPPAWIAVLLAAGCSPPVAPGDAGAGPGGPAPVATPGGVEMVRLPGGWFEMGGDDPDETDQPRHRVYVSPFAIDKHEVTQEEYERLMGANPSRRRGPKNPVEQIRWANAAAYCNERSRREGLKPAYDLKTGRCDFQADGYRLPTEAEWEYAARAGTVAADASGGDAAELDRCAWFKGNCTRGPCPVGEKAPNAWGIFDTGGNVWEWCHDFYGEDYYSKGPERDPRGPETGQNRVVRGGCWNSRAGQCRPSYRNYEMPAFTDACFGKEISGQVGFRCARSTLNP